MFSFTTSSRLVVVRGCLQGAGNASVGTAAGPWPGEEGHQAYQCKACRPWQARAPQLVSENSDRQRSNHALLFPEQRVSSCTCGFGTKSLPVSESALLNWQGVLFQGRRDNAAGEIAALARRSELLRRALVVYVFCEPCWGPCCWRDVDHGRVRRRARYRARPDRHRRARAEGRRWAATKLTLLHKRAPKPSRYCQD